MDGLRNAEVRAYLTGLQQSICDAVGAEDGQTFLTDAWERPPGGKLEGAGITRLIEDGGLLERGGCAFSQVRGTALPTSASMKAISWSRRSLMALLPGKAPAGLRRWPGRPRAP